MPTTPIILTHTRDPETGLTMCGYRWAGDVYHARYVPRVACPACRGAARG